MLTASSSVLELPSRIRSAVFALWASHLDAARGSEYGQIVKERRLSYR